MIVSSTPSRLRVWVGKERAHGCTGGCRFLNKLENELSKEASSPLSLEELDDSFPPHCKSHSRRATVSRQLSVPLNQPT